MSNGLEIVCWDVVCKECNVIATNVISASLADMVLDAHSEDEPTHLVRTFPIPRMYNFRRRYDTNPSA